MQEEAFRPLHAYDGVDFTNIRPLQLTNEHLKHTLRSKKSSCLLCSDILMGDDVFI